MAASSAALSLTVPERGRQTTVAFPKPDLQPATGSPVPELDDALLDEVVVQLARAGVAVYATPDAATPVIDVSEPGPVSLLANQGRNDKYADRFLLCERILQRTQELCGKDFPIVPRLCGCMMHGRIV